MDKKNIGTYSILDVETVEAADYSGLWFIENKEQLKTRKYAKERFRGHFSDDFDKVYYWVGVNRERLRGLTLEQQEEIMIEEGILTYDEI